jgi:hypothetical protein
MTTGGRQVQYNKVRKTALSKPKQNSAVVNAALDKLNKGENLVDVMEWVYKSGNAAGIALAEIGDSE